MATHSVLRRRSPIPSGESGFRQRHSLLYAGLMGRHRQPHIEPRGRAPRGRSFLDLFFPDWRQARDRRRKAVAVLFLLAFAAMLLTVLARRFGWDPASLLFWLRRI